MASKAIVGFKDWFDGVKSPGGVLAPRSESKSEAAGHATRGILEGGLVGVATGIADGLVPGGTTPKQLGIAAVAAGLAATAFASKPIGRTFSNAAVGLAAIATHVHAGAKTAHIAGTTSQVLTNKAKAIAAHGEGAMAGDLGGLDAGEDPLIAEGARLFG